MTLTSRHKYPTKLTSQRSSFWRISKKWTTRSKEFLRNRCATISKSLRSNYLPFCSKRNETVTRLLRRIWKNSRRITTICEARHLWVTPLSLESERLSLLVQQRQHAYNIGRATHKAHQARVHGWWGEIAHGVGERVPRSVPLKLNLVSHPTR